MILGNDFEFSKEDYNEIHDLILSKLQNVSDEYTIAEVALGLHYLIFDVLYDIEQEIMELDRNQMSVGN